MKSVLLFAECSVTFPQEYKNLFGLHLSTVEELEIEGGNVLMLQLLHADPTSVAPSSDP